MGTPEEKGIKNLSVRRSLSNGLSIALMGISSVLGISGCSKEEKSHAMQEGNNIEIPLSDYPSSEENFILDDRRTNREKIEIIKSVAPDDYRKEAALLAGEWERMGMDESDLEIVASVVDGKSWVLVARSRGDGRVFVPRINGVIQASLHLFGRLDEAGDFFDLVPVAVEGATVVGDESGWHVVARVEGGAVTEWYDAAADEVRVVESAEPSPTPDARFQNLLPETLAEARENNVLRRDHLEEDLAMLIEKEKEANIDASLIQPFDTLIPSADIKKEERPSFITLDIMNLNSLPITSISVLETKEGKQLYVLGIPIKRSGSETAAVLHFAVDLEATKISLEQRGMNLSEFENNINIENIYDELKSGNYNEMFVNLILWRGSAEEGGVWDPLLSLLPTEDLNDEYYYYVGDLKKAAHSDDEEARRIFSYFDDKILPCVSIGVIY